MTVAGAAGIPMGRERGKRVLGIAALAVALPLYASYRARRWLLGERAFRDSSQALSMIPGARGEYLRMQFYRLALEGCGEGAQIVFGTIFSTPRARIGDHVYIGAFCNIGWADIGDDVLLGSNVHILSGRSQHGIADLATPVRLQQRGDRQVSIGEDTWIGNGAMIMAHVGRKCVVGAGSVVTSDVEDYSIVAGNPAVLIKRRV